MTLNEKLELIANLEAEGLSEELIEGIMSDIENPEPIGKRYKSFQDMLSDMNVEEER